MPAIEQYYDDIAHITELNYKLLTIDDAYSRKGRKQLLHGRVIVLRDGVSYPKSAHACLVSDSHCSISDATSG